MKKNNNAMQPGVYAMLNSEVKNLKFGKSMAGLFKRIGDTYAK